MNAQNKKDLQPTRIEKAHQLDKLAKGSLFQLVRVLKEINEEEFFIELGYSTMKDYCQKSLNYSLRSAERYLSISEKFGDYADFEQKAIGTRATTTLNLETITNLPLVKLEHLSRLQDSEIKNLVETGEITLAGKTLTLETIKETSREELAKIISISLGEVKDTGSKVIDRKTLSEQKVNIMKLFDKVAYAVVNSGLPETSKDAFEAIISQLYHYKQNHLAK